MKGKNLIYLLLFVSLIASSIEIDLFAHKNKEQVNWALGEIEK